MLRPAIYDDIPKIKYLMQSEPGFWQDKWDKGVIEIGIKSADGLCFVYEEAARLLGFICAHDLGFRAYLSELIVDASARHRGVGTKLVRHIESELTAKGRCVIISDVWRSAEKFYKSLGWSEPDVIFLRKTLGGG